MSSADMLVSSGKWRRRECASKFGQYTFAIVGTSPIQSGHRSMNYPSVVDQLMMTTSAT